MIITRELPGSEKTLIQCDLNISNYLWAQPLDDKRTYVKMGAGPDIIVLMPFPEFLKEKEKHGSAAIT